MKKFWMLIVVILILGGLAGAYYLFFTPNYLVMGTNAEFPPFEMRGGADGTAVVGFDVEVARAIADKTGRPLKVEDLPFDSLLPALATGRVDMVLAGLTITPERSGQVDFSSAYYKATQVVMIRKGDPVPTSQDDLKGRKIAAQYDTTSAKLALEITGKKHFRQQASSMKAVVALMNSRVDFVILDEEPAIFFEKMFERDIQLVRLGFDAEFYGVAVQTDNAELLAQVNEVLGEIALDGRYDQFFDLWMVQQVEFWEEPDVTDTRR